MANENVSDIAANKLKCIVANRGQYMETLRQHAGSTVAVLPHGIDWSPVIESADTLEAITTMPLPARKSIGMDMVPPFAVYVDGQKVAEHATEDEADDLYAQLRVTHLGKLNPAM